MRVPGDFLQRHPVILPDPYSCPPSPQCLLLRSNAGPADERVERFDPRAVDEQRIDLEFRELRSQIDDQIADLTYDFGDSVEIRSLMVTNSS